jgi:hypothetical protein
MSRSMPVLAMRIRSRLSMGLERGGFYYGVTLLSTPNHTRNHMFGQ